MHGVRHRVAPLRRSSTQLGETPPTHTTGILSSQHSRTGDLHTQRGSHMLRSGPASWMSQSSSSLPPPPPLLRSQTTITTAGGVKTTKATGGYGYALPTAMQRSQLTIPHTQVADSASLHAVLTQTAQQHKETTAALLGLVESFQNHEKHLVSGSANLTHLTTVVNGQHAQVAALHGIAEEMRAMTAVIRDAVALLHPTRQQQQHTESIVPFYSTSRTPTTTVVLPPADDGYGNSSNSDSNTGIQLAAVQERVCTCPSATTFVLGADTPPMTPHVVGSDANEESVKDNTYHDEGAAYFCNSQLKRVVLRCGEAAIPPGVMMMPFVEDDVFSM